MLVLLLAAMLHNIYHISGAALGLDLEKGVKVTDSTLLGYM